MSEITESRIISILDKNVWVQTNKVCDLLSVSKGEETRKIVRDLLKSMKRKGIVERRGTTKFLWRLSPSITKLCSDMDTLTPEKHKHTEHSPEKLQKIRNYIDANPILIKCKLAFAPEYPVPDNPVLADMRKSLYSYGRLTPKQISFAGKLYEEHKEAIFAKCVGIPETNEDDNASESNKSFPHSKSEDLANEKIRALKDMIAELESKLEKAQSGGHVKKLIVETNDKKTVIKDVVLPPNFEMVLELAGARRNIMLVGPAGCGKTHLGELVANSLGLEFSAISCTSGMSESHLLGRAVPNLTKGTTEFQTTDFLRRYEGGGVMLIDEIDAADPNTLMILNSAIANGYCSVPNRTDAPVARRHKDFIIIASANTFGRGATRVYAGRNQLDGATLDRFQIGMVECYYSSEIEKVLCPDDSLRELLQAIRKEIEAAGLRRTMSTRFMQDAYIMRSTCNWTDVRILQRFFEGWSREEMLKVPTSVKAS